MAGYYNITNRSFRDASAYLRHQLSDSFRLPPTNLPTLPTNQSPSFLSHFTFHYYYFYQPSLARVGSGLRPTPFPGRQGVLQQSFLFLNASMVYCSVRVSLFWLSLSASAIDCPERLVSQMTCYVKPCTLTHSLKPSILPSSIRG